MDFQDIVGLIIVVLISLLGSTKRKRHADEPSTLESESTSVEEIRRRIESLKRERAQTPQSTAQLSTAQPPSATKLQPAKPTFSAYKHLPEAVKTCSLPEVPKEKTFIPERQVKLESPLKAQSSPKLRNWVLGQVILGKPVSLSYYHGNFEHR